eukprot:gene33094-42527_t
MNNAFNSKGDAETQSRLKLSTVHDSNASTRQRVAAIAAGIPPNRPLRAPRTTPPPTLRLLVTCRLSFVMEAGSYRQMATGRRAQRRPRTSHVTLARRRRRDGSVASSLFSNRSRRLFDLTYGPRHKYIGVSARGEPPRRSRRPTDLAEERDSTQQSAA